MKKIVFSSAIILSLVFTYGTSSAQVSLSVNIGLQPEWGPVGYDYVDYYYFPQYEAYYFVPKRQFVYLNNGRWLFANSLPRRYGTVNLFSSYKVVINEPNAYKHHNDHKVKYVKYKGGGEKQEIIRDSKDAKYVKAREAQKRGNAKETPAKDVRPKQQKSDANVTPQKSNAKKQEVKKQPKGNKPN